MKFNIILVLEILATAVTTEILYKLFVKYRDKRKSKSIKNIHEVIIFNDLQSNAFNRYGSVPNPGIERILHHFKSARHSLDICMYVFTNKILSTQLIMMARRGIAIRMIIDRDMALSAGSQMFRLMEKGIPVRYKNSPHIMHHKFCLIDARDEEGGILMTGSLNWTSNAMYNNWENVAVTSQRELLLAYRDEFQRLWEEFGTSQEMLSAGGGE